MRVVPATADGIRFAADALCAGEIIAYPTETLYGLGVDPRNDEAIGRLFRSKGRADDKPVLLIIDSLAQLEGFAGGISPAARRFIERIWPGPLSLLLPSEEGVSPFLSGSGGKICVRCPSCETSRAICREFGGPITSTSANPAGGRPARAVADLDFPDIAVAVDGGVLAENLASTVFDPDTGRVHREGAISQSVLKTLL